MQQFANQSHKHWSREKSREMQSTLTGKKQPDCLVRYAEGLAFGFLGRQEDNQQHPAIERVSFETEYEGISIA